MARKANSSPRISILLPVKDGGPFLSTAVDSIREQTLSSWELLLVDDHSEDSGINALSSRLQSDPRIRMLANSGQGLPAALNHGLKEARAPFIARMDADDWSHPRRLERQIQLLKEHPDWGLVGCRVKHTNQSGQRTRGYQYYVQWINSLLNPLEIYQNRFIESPLAHPSVVFRKSCVEQFGGYREGDFPEDYELWLRWLEAGVRMGKCPETLLHWNDHPNRLSRTHSAYRPEVFYRIKAYYLSHWIRTHLPADRPIWIWGAGRTSRKRAEFLEDYGLFPEGYIDIDSQKINQTLQGRPVVAPEKVPPSAFILGYVGSRGARDAIRNWFHKHQREVEKDYLFAA